MAEVRRTPQAETDLAEILEYLHQHNPSVAEHYATAFYDKGQALARFPETGRSRPEIAPNLRSTLVKSYVIFYRLDGNAVQIVRILYGKRDLRSIMQAESEE